MTQLRANRMFKLHTRQNDTAIIPATIFLAILVEVFEILRKTLSNLNSTLNQESLISHSPNPHREPATDGRGEPRHEFRRAGGAATLADHLDVERPHHGHGDRLHLGDGELLAEAHAEARLEHRVPVEALRREGAAGAREPAVGAEGVVVGAPDARHAAHGVGVVRHAGAAGHVGAVGEHVVAGAELGVELHGREQAHVLVQRRVGVVQALEAVVGDGVVSSSGGLRAHGGRHGRVLGQEHEERGERGGHSVAPREEEADDDVSEVRVVLVDELDGLPELPLRPDRRGRRSAHGAEPRGRVERVGELGHGHVPVEAARVEAEGDLADGVEGEASEHVLQVDDRARAGGIGEDGQEACLHLLRDDLVGVGAHGDAAELEAGHLALVAPGAAVDVEDAAAEEVPEERGEGGALGEVVEVGPEHVLDVGRVGGDGAAEDVDVDGGRGGVPEEVRVPVAEVGEVPRPRPREVGAADVAAAPRPPAHQQEHGAQRRHAEGGGQEGRARALRRPWQVVVHGDPLSRRIAAAPLSWLASGIEREGAEEENARLCGGRVRRLVSIYSVDRGESAHGARAFLV
ncbi:hypothetical protein BS78_05G050400 [Paspalum vaginatum]|nr:hypothetical protein BS78_05G050400 [Paspalum vaginatum]